MIFVDSLMSHGWVLRGKHVMSCHLMSDTGEEELVAFAARIGLEARWLRHSRLGMPHFDLIERKRIMAIKRGAKELTRNEIVALIERNKADAKKSKAQEQSAS